MLKKASMGTLSWLTVLTVLVLLRGWYEVAKGAASKLLVAEVALITVLFIITSTALISKIIDESAKSR